jgi:hypothetical protein
MLCVQLKACSALKSCHRPHQLYELWGLVLRGMRFICRGTNLSRSFIGSGSPHITDLTRRRHGTRHITELTQ